MPAHNHGLIAEPLFVGATRPPMRWGVTYSALLFNLLLTIVENCGNTLILRCGASEHGGTSQFASRLIGEREVIRRQRTQGRDGGATLKFQPARRSTQTTAHSVLEAAVLAAELEQLPDLCGYFKPASSRYWLQVQLVH